MIFQVSEWDWTLLKPRLVLKFCFLLNLFIVFKYQHRSFLKIVHRISRLIVAREHKGTSAN